MSEVKWIKITTDIFDDEKILLIESLPESDAIIVIWFKLLCLAGKMNNSGVFVLNESIPINVQMLSTIFRRKEATVSLAIETFVKFGMVEIVDNVITIPNWGKHQNLDKIEEKQKYMREYMRGYREKQRQRIGTKRYNQLGLDEGAWTKVLGEFNYECAYCGSDDDLEQDHIIPVNDGGTYEIENIVPACRRCNSSKGAKDVTVWYPEQEFFDEERMDRIVKHAGKHLRKYLRKANVNSLDKEEDKEIEINNICSEPKNGSEPPVAWLPLNTGVEYPITREMFDEWQRLYPAVDVKQELNKMRGWCISNPSKRKTKTGIKRFINGWLSREQDKGGTPGFTMQNKQAASADTPKRSYKQVRREDGSVVTVVVNQNE